VCVDGFVTMLRKPFAELSILVEQHLERLRHNKRGGCINELGILSELDVDVLLDADLSRRIAK